MKNNELKKKEQAAVEEVVPYGLLVGSTLGVIIELITSELMWIAIGPTVGLLMGIAIGNILSNKRKKE